METLEKIQHFADAAHGDQLRKYTPDRYMVHPVRVMHLCRAFTTDETLLAGALLHDVLEDTPVTAGEIKAFLVPLLGVESAEKALRLVVELTDVYVKRDYPQWNRRKRKHLEAERMATISPGAQTIGREIVRHDPSFARIFLKECKQLLKRMPRGNPFLYKAAITEINNGLHALHTAGPVAKL